MTHCKECFDGKIIDEQHPDYDTLDQELIRLIDGGQFSYYAAFKRATRLYPAVKDCPECNGTGKAE
ncbi:hypothetical protein [Bacillus massiliigorillae]|uniref:hypothetical protein n=1 Tax=Bacillus massiliigorillae TaxID=1243664 RepID=UPI0003A65664|nr:hypothetical protein [Bacillus massiliigorillae]